MKKPSLWLIIAFLGIGYFISGNEDKKPARTSGFRTTSVESNLQPHGLIQATTTQNSADALAPTTKSSPFIGINMYVAKRANMRMGPSTDFRVITVVDKGEQVKVLNARNDWYSIEYNNRTGWISSSLLTDETLIIKPAPKMTRTLPAQAAAPARQNRSGQAIRQPYVGTCDCPYDLMRNGRRCGGRSAYSRPGGRSPQCYF